MFTVQGKELVTIDGSQLARLLDGYADVAIDIGTGDGRYVYRQAAAHPHTFYIGVDATSEHLAEYSAKVSKKPSRGGLPNALYVKASAECLPVELGGIASAITINFPWSSLLTGLVGADDTLLGSIAGVAKPDARLDVFINHADFFLIGSN